MLSTLLYHVSSILYYAYSSAPPFVHGNIEGDGYNSFATKAEAASAWYDHLREHGMDNLTTVSASSPFPVLTHTSRPSSSERPPSFHNPRPLTPPASQNTVDEEESALNSNASIKITATDHGEDSVSTGNSNDIADDGVPGSDADWPDAASEGLRFASRPSSMAGDFRDGPHPLPGASRAETGGFGAGGPGVGGFGTSPFAGHGFSGPNYSSTSPPFSISVSGIVPPTCPYIFFVSLLLSSPSSVLLSDVAKELCGRHAPPSSPACECSATS